MKFHNLGKQPGEYMERNVLNEYLLDDLLALVVAAHHLRLVVVVLGLKAIVLSVISQTSHCKLTTGKLGD